MKTFSPFVRPIYHTPMLAFLPTSAAIVEFGSLRQPFERNSRNINARNERLQSSLELFEEEKLIRSHVPKICRNRHHYGAVFEQRVRNEQPSVSKCIIDLQFS